VKKNNFLDLLKAIEASPVIEASIVFNDYQPIDLSVSNSDLSNFSFAKDYENYIESHLEKHHKKIAYGGYLEKRNLYKRSAVFAENTKKSRDIHLGIDFWINTQASIHAAVDGVIHSFQDNNALGDYGPTIILEHLIKDTTFYTLYGHLSRESLVDKHIGKKVKKGETIAYLGLPPINGDYAPHLHFQIIKDLEGKTGDYPGVCHESDVEFYKENCPDPMVLLSQKN
jgi:murein DD-endopeptidase MepM/ murein hydrolase activator NlpD